MFASAGTMERTFSVVFHFLTASSGSRIRMTMDALHSDRQADFSHIELIGYPVSLVLKEKDLSISGTSTKTA